MTIDSVAQRSRRAGACALAVAVMLAFSTTITAQSGNPKVGAEKAVTCQACHGLDGLAKLPDAPNLAGQNAVYFVKAMKDYQNGARKDERMSVVVKGLSPQDIEDLAAFYAALPGLAKPPQ